MNPTELERLKDEVKEKKFTRLGPADPVSTDDDNLAITFAMPLEPAKQTYGNEILELNDIVTVDATGSEVWQDGDRSKKLGKFAGATLEAGRILVTVKFNSENEYLAVQNGGAEQVAMQYKAGRFSHEGDNTFKLMRLFIYKIGIFSKGHVPKKSKKRFESYFSGPQIRISPVKYKTGNAPGNVTVQPDDRTVTVEFGDNLPFAQDYGELLRLAGNPHWGRLHDKEVMPCRNGEIVFGAAPLGQLERVYFENEKVDDLDTEDQKKTVVHYKAVIKFADTAAGNAESAAFTTGEKRGAVLALRAFRVLHGEQVKTQNVAAFIDWQPLWIGIEGGAIVSEAENQAARAPAPAPASVKVGLLDRVKNSLTGKGSA